MLGDIHGIGAKVLAWKNKHSNVYYQQIGDNDYVFRLLTKSEYTTLRLVYQYSPNDAEDELLELCVLYPENSASTMNELYAGEANTLVECILTLSGFSNSDGVIDDLEIARSEINSFDNQIVLVICKAFPHISPSDIDKFDYPTMMTHVALAEAILGTRLEVTKTQKTPLKQPIDFKKDNLEQGGGETPLSYKFR